MPITSDALRRLAKLNLAPEALSEVLTMFADMQSQEEDRLRKQREKKQRQRGTLPGLSRDNPETVPPAEGDKDAPAQAPTCVVPDLPSLPSEVQEPKKEKNKDDQREQARLISLEFENEFWPAYPRRIAKADAMKAFASARAKGVDLTVILVGLERYKREKPAYADWKHPGPWIRAERWNDEPDQVNGHSTAQTVLKLSDIPDYHAVQAEKRALGIVDDV